MRATLLLIPTLLFASESAPLPQVVYVPFDQAPDVAVGKQGIMLPYEQFLKLWDKANPAKPDPSKIIPPVSAALTGYALSGQTKGELAELTLNASISALSEGWSSVVLPAGLALKEFSASDKRVLIQRSDAGLVVHLPAPGTYTITAVLAAPISKDAAGRRSLAVLAPAAAAGRLDLLIADTQADVAVSPAVAVSTAAEKDGTRLKAVLGAAAQVVVSWQPPVKAAIGEALLIANTDVALTIDERSLRYDLTAVVSILRRPVQELTLTIPADSQVLAVDAPGLRTWERTGDQLRLLLHEPVEGAWRATIRLERLLSAVAPGESRALEIAWPTVAGATRATGTMALIPGEGLSLTIGAHDGLSQIDPAEVKVAGAIAAFRHLAAATPMAVSVARLQSELRANLHQLVRLGVDEDVIAVQVDLDVRKAGVFILAFDVPATWEPGDITGLAIDDVRVGPVLDGRKRIDVALRGRLLGSGTAVMRFRAPPSIPRAGTVAPGLDIGVVRLPDARQVRGTLAIALPRSWALNATARTSLTGSEAEPLRREGAIAALSHDLNDSDDLPLAYTFFAGPNDKPSLTVTASPRPRELALRQEDVVTVAEGSVRRLLTWRGEVRYSPLPALRVQIPSAYDDRITFKGVGLADHTAATRADGLTTWELRFQTPVIGAFTVTAEMTSELPPLQAGQPTAVPVPMVKPLDATRLDAVLAVAREGTLEVSASAVGMETLAPADLPAPVQTPGLVTGFQGAAPVAAELSVTRHDLVRLADGVVTLAHYAAALGDDGVVRVMGRLALSTRGRPWLELRLPEGADLLEVALGGRPGRPSRRGDGVVVVPLGDGAGSATTVSLVYELHILNGRPGLTGTLRLPLPTVGGGGEHAAPLPVERSEVVLYLPDQLAVTHWHGDFSPLSLNTSLWEALMRDVTPTMNSGDGGHGDPSSEGLTVPVALHGTRHTFARLGDGGVINVCWWRRGVIDVVALLLASVALVSAWWCRSHAARLGALALVATVAVAAASGVWLVVAAGLAGGTAVGLILTFVRWIALRPRRVSAPTVVEDPWKVVEQTPPMPPSPPTTPTEPTP